MTWRASRARRSNTYLNGMMDATKTAIFGECKAVLKELFPQESDYIDAISPCVPQRHRVHPPRLPPG